MRRRAFSALDRASLLCRCGKIASRRSRDYSLVAMGSDATNLPSLVVFDLDACLWDPEMYQMRAGSPFRYDQKRGVAIARDGEQVHLLGAVREVLRELHTDPKWVNSQVAIASSCDEPEWARELLKLFPIEVGEGKSVSMGSIFHAKEIRYGNKQSHFQNLHKTTGIAFKDMIFFDDQMYNINAVRGLGVTCQHTPRGLTREAWLSGLKAFVNSRSS